MKYHHSLRRLLPAAALACIAGPALASTASARPVDQPAFVLGPAAIVSTRVAPAGGEYLLFTCQFGQVPGVNCYDPYQMRHAYGTDQLINEGWDGSGKTIVIVDAFQNPNIKYELSYFDNWYQLPVADFTQVAPQGLTPFDYTNPDMAGWAFEISLDVEWAHAIAPGARIVLVLAKSDLDQDLYDATQYAVDHHLGDVISQSFGEDESCMDPNLLRLQHRMFAEAAREGITIFASAGDSGAAQLNCDGTAYVKAVSDPASDPLVTAVGGTDLHAADYSNPSIAPGTYRRETVWNESAAEVPPVGGAGGGGFSVLYSEPFYQQEAVDGRDDARGVPDVSYNAAVLDGVLTFVDVCPAVFVCPISPGFYLVGGTSAGSPQWAAITAIADEKKGEDLGFINRGLYLIGQTPLYRWLFHDILVGNNSFAFGDVRGFNARRGWDAASGLGSPQAPGLVDLLIQTVSFGDDDSASANFKGNNANLPSHGYERPH